MKIERIRCTQLLAGGATGGVFDLHVQDTSELPELGSILDGKAVLNTSIAVTNAGVWYKLEADGKWYVQDGSGDSVTPSED